MGWAVYNSLRTQSVLDLVSEERKRQEAMYPENDSLLDGTGPNVRWLEVDDPGIYTKGAEEIELALRCGYERHEETSRVTWMHLVREEVAEVFVEDDPSRLKEELIQLAALAVSWVERLNAREEQDE